MTNPASTGLDFDEDKYYGPRDGIFAPDYSKQDPIFRTPNPCTRDFATAFNLLDSELEEVMKYTRQRLRAGSGQEHTDESPFVRFRRPKQPVLVSRCGDHLAIWQIPTGQHSIKYYANIVIRVMGKFKKLLGRPVAIDVKKIGWKTRVTSVYAARTKLCERLVMKCCDDMQLNKNLRVE